METYNKLKSIVSGIENDVTKFHEKGNSAAGTRIRKAMQELKAIANDYRKEVQSAKKSDSAE